MLLKFYMIKLIMKYNGTVQKKKISMRILPIKAEVRQKMQREKQV